jgi:hypothetical protein
MNKRILVKSLGKARKLHVWVPRHPTRFGFDPGTAPYKARVLSLKFIMVRWFARDCP